MKMPMSVYKYMSMPRYMVLTKINIFRRRKGKNVHMYLVFRIFLENHKCGFSDLNKHYHPHRDVIMAGLENTWLVFNNITAR